MDTATPSSSPRWQPTSEEELRTAIDAGHIEESHYFDAKQQITNGTNANKNLATDLAAFAIDGGTLAVGIAENDAGQFTLAPQQLDGLAERVERVALDRCDPPLPVICRAIPSNDDSSHGYLIVHVPPSPQAPHMVEGRYWGRGDKTNRRLADPEVRRLHQLRAITDEDTIRLLRREIAEDPLPDDDRSHLFLVAQPLAGRDDMLLDLTGAPDCNLRLARLIENAVPTKLNGPFTEEASPTLSSAGNGFRRAAGAAKATPNLGVGRRYTGDGEAAIEFQARDDGGLRIYSSRLSDERNGEQVIIDGTAVALTRRLIALALAVAEESGYRGGWALAIGAIKLRNRKPSSTSHDPFSRAEAYSEDTYERATAASWAELDTNPGAVTNRLVGRLLRALGTEANHTALTTSPAPADPDLS